MKVLWILNSPLPEALTALTGQSEISHATGSWVCALAEALGKDPGVELFTAAPAAAVKRVQKVPGDTATHYLLPKGWSDWRLIQDEVRPDVVHIHGTEYPVSLDYVQRCGSSHVVVSLQGLVSECRHVYYGGIPEETIKAHISLRDMIRRDSMVSQKQDMWHRGDLETALLKQVHHIIGRTSWDKKVSLGINPNLHYHFCNEALRDPFYSGKWDYPSCVPHRIFLSQGHIPIKGAHILFEALPAVIERYPDTSVHIAGPNVLRGQSVKDRLLRNGYAVYLSELIRHNHLEHVVKFLGESDALAIRKELLEANVYVQTSIIENSPNSLGEAQILGVPCVASDVGGTATLIPGPAEGILYPFGDINALSKHILALFERVESFDNAEMTAFAADRHNRRRILSDLKSIYDEVKD